MRVLALALALACGGDPAPPPNLLLVSFDTTRGDHLSSYGYPRATTPWIDALAGQGVRVERAYAPTATTAPSHASLFTSLHPLAHRVVKNGVPLDASHHTLAERLGEAGYQRAAFVSSFVLSARFGFAQGYERFDDAFPERRGRRVQWEGFEVGRSFDRAADATSARAIRWLLEERDPERPFHLFVHYFDPHDPYDPPEPYRSRLAAGAGATPVEEMRARYDAELAFADAELGALLEVLDGLGLAEHTLVVVTADHGEGLWDHGHMTHGIHVYEEAVRVPLVLRWPGRLPAGRVLRGPVHLVDLLPTLLDLLGLDPGPEALHGKSLAAALRGEATLDPERPIFLYRRHYEGSRPLGQFTPRGENFAVLRGRWKYILGPEEGREELFDLARDPAERENRLAEAPGVAAELARALDAWRRRTARDGPAPPPLRPEDREGLRALGYAE